MSRRRYTGPTYRDGSAIGAMESSMGDCAERPWKGFSSAAEQPLEGKAESFGKIFAPGTCRGVGGGAAWASGR